VTIADILSKRLRQGNDGLIRVGNREIQLRGKWKAEEIARVFKTIGAVISKEEPAKRIGEIKSAKIAEARAQLVSLEHNISQYERLVRSFDGISKKKTWQKKRAKEYQKRLTELRNQRDDLASFIDFLSREC